VFPMNSREVVVLYPNSPVVRPDGSVVPRFT
jgi:hypothetical protein